MSFFREDEDAVLMFETWLSTTRELQIESYGHDPTTLEGEEFATFVTWNSWAAVSELVEMMDELDWKPWAKLRGRPEQEARDRAVGEVVDVLHFVGNLAVALGLTDAELSQAYARKVQINRERMRNKPEGYDARGTKCPHCKRALDDVGVVTIPANQVTGPEHKECKGCRGVLP